MVEEPRVARERSARRRVLHLVPTAVGRGAQIFARDLVDELGGAETGHQLAALFDGPSDVPVDLRLHAGPSARGLSPLALSRIRAAISRLQPDVVVAHGGEAYKYAALGTDRPVIYGAIGTLDAQAALGARLRLWRNLVRRAHLVVAVSPEVASELEQVLQVDPGRLRMIPNARRSQRFVPGTREPQIGPSPPIRLVFVGRLEPGKRPERLIELVEVLNAQNLPVTAALVGGGSLEESLRARAGRVGVELVGHRPDVLAYYQAADLLVFPSRAAGEGMPGVLIEAGLCGLPAVSTPVPGATTVVRHGVTGLIVNDDDLCDMVSAVRWLAERVERRATMGAEARRWCQATFDLSVVARQWDATIHTAAAGRPSEPGALTAGVGGSLELDL